MKLPITCSAPKFSWPSFPTGRQIGMTADVHGEAARRVRHKDVPRSGVGSNALNQHLRCTLAKQLGHASLPTWTRGFPCGKHGLRETNRDLTPRIDGKWPTCAFDRAALEHGIRQFRKILVLARLSLVRIHAFELRLQGRGRYGLARCVFRSNPPPIPLSNPPPISDSNQPPAN